MEKAVQKVVNELAEEVVQEIPNETKPLFRLDKQEQGMNRGKVLH